MSKRFILFFLMVPFLGFSQIPKIPGSIGGVLTSTILNKSKDLLITQLDKSKAEYDTTSFNYAIFLYKEKKLGASHPDYAHLLNLQAELYMLMKKTTEVGALLKNRQTFIKKNSVPTILLTQAYYTNNYYNSVQY